MKKKKIFNSQLVIVFLISGLFHIGCNDDYETIINTPINYDIKLEDNQIIEVLKTVDGNRCVLSVKVNTTFV